MSMSIHIIGFIPPDDKWKKMKRIWDACEDPNVDIPTEVLAFFNGEPPDEKGVEIEIEKTEWSNDYDQGFEIEVKKIPKDVKVLRFYYSC